jgi:CMP-N-acetylneuraminic acid synthetase
MEDGANHDNLFTATELCTPPYWPDGRPTNRDPEQLISAHDLPPDLEENSCFCIFNRDSFCTGGRRIGLSPLPSATERPEFIDVDEEMDFIFDEHLTQ